MLRLYAEKLVHFFPWNCGWGVTPPVPVLEGNVLCHVEVLEDLFDLLKYLNPPLLLNLRANWEDDLSAELGLLCVGLGCFHPDEHNHVDLVLSIRELVNDFVPVTLQEQVRIKANNCILDFSKYFIGITLVISSEVFF